MDARLKAALDRAYFISTLGRAMLVTPELETAIAEYAESVREHADASDAVMALSHLNAPPAEHAAVHTRLVSADDRRDALARDLADEVLVALGVR